jgi:hypothetical protein
VFIHGILLWFHLFLTRFKLADSMGGFKAVEEAARQQITLKVCLCPRTSLMHV